MTILVDIDSTITNFGEMLLLRNNQSHETYYKYTDITSYDWMEQTFDNPWLPTEDKVFWDAVKINPAAITTIEKWIKQGHKVYFVSASHFNNMLSYKINKTIESFNPELINERNIIIAQDKSVVRGTIMIDDYEENLNNFNGIKVCYSQPWNKKRSAYLLRTSDWNKLKEMIETIPFN